MDQSLIVSSYISVNPGGAKQMIVLSENKANDTDTKTDTDTDTDRNMLTLAWCL